MNMTQRSSGLVVPVTKPQPPPASRGPLEIWDDDDRKQAKDALSELWHASGLYGDRHPMDAATMAARLHAWRMLSSVLLGDEFMECEQLT